MGTNAEQTTGTAPGTAVASSRKADLPPEAVALIDQRKAINAVAAEIANLTWGREYNRVALRAIADWGARHGVDVTTEIDVLGGRLYLNARFYLNRAAPLIHSGVIVELSTHAINADPRLSAIAADTDATKVAEADRAAFEERRRRAQMEVWQRENLRIEFGIPDDAQAAFVATCRVRGVPNPFVAAQWAGGRGMKQTKYGPKLRDPVGEDRPVETAETRALRRVLRMIVSHVPQFEALVGPAIEEAGTELQEIMDTTRQEEAAQVVEHRQHVLGAGTGMVSTPSYVEEALAEATPDVRAAAARAMASIDNPYEGEPEPISDAEIARMDQEHEQEQTGELPLGDTRKSKRRDAVRDGGR